MNTPDYEALIVAGAALTSEEHLSPKAVQRMDTALDAWHHHVAPSIITSGGHSFMADTPPSVSEASVMRDYAVRSGVPEQAIYIEDESLDTVGNALFTKTQVVVPNDWDRLIVVTSETHLPRTLRLFRHIMGKDIEVDGISSPEHITPRDRAHELIGAMVMREVFRGTKTGDDDAIRERLFDLVPGYADSSKKHLAIHSLRGLIRRA